MKATTASQEATRDSFGGELLDRTEIANEYKIPVPTQCSWFSLNRFGWRELTIRVGARVLVRRRDLESWLDSRRGLVAEPRAKKPQREAVAA
jgi:hypothetical protein